MKETNLRLTRDSEEQSRKTVAEAQQKKKREKEK